MCTPVHIMCMLVHMIWAGMAQARKGPSMTEAVPPEAPDEALDDLRARIRRTRRVANPWADDRARGLPAAELDALLEHWATAYDWRGHCLLYTSDAADE